jgi:hypothetical protein
MWVCDTVIHFGYLFCYSAPHCLVWTAFSTGMLIAAEYGGQEVLLSLLEKYDAVDADGHSAATGKRSVSSEEVLTKVHRTVNNEVTTYSEQTAARGHRYPVTVWTNMTDGVVVYSAGRSM